MQLKLKTLTLQEMVTKAAKGASSNKMIPITSLMMIELSKNILTLTTTNASSTLQIIERGVEGEDFFAVVPVEIFSKLISKITTDFVMLSLKENGLEIKGNGVYLLDLALDEQGKMIKFPTIPFDLTIEKQSISTAAIRSMLASNKAALAVTMEQPYLTGYYCEEDKVVTTDSFKVCSNQINAFHFSTLLPAELVELLALLGGETISLQQSGNKVLFTSPNAILYGSELEGKEDYPASAIESYLKTEFKSEGDLPKTALLNALDRLSLFVSPYDERGIYITFTEAGLLLKSKSSNSAEQVNYATQRAADPFICCIDVELLKSQVNAHEAETIHIGYGHDTALKLSSGKITQILALLEDGKMTDESVKS